MTNDAARPAAHRRAPSRSTLKLWIAALGALGTVLVGLAGAASAPAGPARCQLEMPQSGTLHAVQ